MLLFMLRVLDAKQSLANGPLNALDLQSAARAEFDNE